MLNKKGQSTLEYAIIIAVVIAGLLVMQHYVKRGYEGRLKGASDEMGQQYDPVSYSGKFNVKQSARVEQRVVDLQTTTTQLDDQVSNRTGQEHQTVWGSTSNIQGLYEQQ